MPVVHFKRYRMMYDLNLPVWQYQIPAGYRWQAWRTELLETHSSIKHRSFQSEVDANVFPCFSSLSSCQRLMHEITRREGFLPQATWLVYTPSYSIATTAAGKEAAGCGTIQGIKLDSALGSIQNLGVTPNHRGLGLGRALLARAVEGFKSAGLERAILEVTCDNFGAVRLYQKLGWTIEKTVFKSSEITTMDL